MASEPRNEGEDFQTPGQLIQSLLDERGWTQNVLAVVLGVSQSIVARLANDKRPVDAARAIELSEVFGVEAERFLELQKRYDLAKARIEMRPDPRRALRAKLYGDLPVSEMARRGWIDVKSVRDVGAVEKSLAKFFGVARPEEIEVLSHAPKKTAVGEDVTPAQLAWLYRVRAIAKEMIVAPFSEFGLRRGIDRLRSLLLSAEEVRHVPRILGECGVRFVVVETLASAKIDGVCFWLRDDAPVIGLSLRHDRIDNFWFVLRHELEHVLRGHGRGGIMLDAELEGERAGVGPDIREEERAANEAASDFCVPRESMRQFVARKAPMFPELDLLGFARTLRVHPGLVAGQLQHHTGRYDRFRGHLVKVRSAVLPSAVVDGWGNVVPLQDD